MNNIQENYKNRLGEILNKFKEELKGIRVNRPTASLIEDLSVDYYGSKTPLSHLASIQIKPPREILVQVWDQEAMKSVSDAIKGSDLGLSINSEGKTLRLFMPELSQERRNELIKHLKKIAEMYRIEVRNERDIYNKDIEDKEKDNEISEDDKYRLKESIQKETQNVNNEIEKSVEEKIEKIKL